MAEPILSYELKSLLDYIKESMVPEFPVNTITLNYLVLAILDNQTCDGYVVLSKLMMNNSISELKGYMANVVLADCQSDIKTSKESTFSKEFDEIAADIAEDGKTVTSALMLKHIIMKNSDIKYKLNSLGVTMEQLSDVAIAYSGVNTVKQDVKNNKHAKKKTVKTKSESNNTDTRTIPEENNAVEANCENLVRFASTGMFDDIIGMDDVVDDIFDVLGKYDRNTVAIIGPSGVGKTSIVKRLAKRIYDKKCPKPFRDKYVMKFGDQINNIIINEMNRLGKYVAFIDDVERMFANKDSEANNLYVLNELFKAPNISTIICMNDSQYSKVIESKPDISRKIHKVKVDEPGLDELAKIVSVSVRPLTEFNNVEFDDGCVKEAIRLAKQFITTEKAPKSAINILDMAASHIRMNKEESKELTGMKDRLNEIINLKNSIPNSGNSSDFDEKDKLIRDEIDINKKISKLEDEEYRQVSKVKIDDVRYAASKITGVPLTEMDESEKTKLKNLFNNLTAHVIGQDEAVESICRAVKRQRVGLSNPNKPCVMLLCGNTGVGKCVCGDTIVKIRNKKTNEIQEITLNEFKKLRLTQQN